MTETHVISTISEYLVPNGREPRGGRRGGEGQQHLVSACGGD